MRHNADVHREWKGTAAGIDPDRPDERRAGAPSIPLRTGRALATIALLAAALTSAQPAGATFVGVNGRIAFVSREDGDREIFTVKADGSGLTQLTFNEANDTAPAWSPDGKLIAFASDRDGDWDIYLMAANGTGVVNFTEDSPWDESSPAWSPDGTRLAFVSDRTGVQQIYRQNISGSWDWESAIQLTSQGKNLDPDWSDTSGIAKIVFSSDRDGDFEIFTMYPNGTLQTQLTSSSRRETRPKWGKYGKIYYQRLASGDWELWSMGSSGNNQQAVTANSAHDTDPAGSPDGTKIAYISDAQGDPDLYVANANGSSPVKLTVNPVRDQSPNWQRTPALVLQPLYVYAVSTVAHGTSVDVHFKTSTTVTEPVVHLRSGEAFRLRKGDGTGTSWSVTVGFLKPGTTYDLEIVLYKGPGSWVTYKHPAPVTTLKRRVTITARYAQILDDGDVEGCGDLDVQIYLLDYPPSLNTPNGSGNGCYGYWDFPNQTLVVEGIKESDLRVGLASHDDDNDIDGGFDPVGEKASGTVTLDLLGTPETFTRTETVSLNPDPAFGGTLEMDMTFDYRVEYHP